jgi:UDP-2,4-diacetamido-2,4,6-trideoxy-beta-L-altropyranose hydrolase
VISAHANDRCVANGLKALFLTVAGPNEGLGHLLRCRVLMLEMARKGWALELLFVGSPAILERWDWPAAITSVFLGESPGDDAVHAALARKLAETDIRWTVIDSYRFRGASWRDQVNGAHARLLILDDIGDQAFTADAILNQNGADRDFYTTRGISAEHWLLGPQYALIEPEYVVPRDKPVNAQLEKVLVVFGGSDRRWMTPKSVTALLALEPPLQLDVVLGPYSTWVAPPSSQPGLVFHRAPAGLAPLMRQADLIVTAAGSTAWQACAAGCPAVVVQTVDNQAQVVATLLVSQAALIADADKLDKELPHTIEALRPVEARIGQIKRARNLVDGNGAARVVEALRAW